MPHFHMMFIDKPNSLELRLKTRPAHVDYINSFGAKIKLAGPFLNDEGNPIGSIIVIEAEDYEAALDYARNDPYRLADLFEHVAISPYNPVLGAWVAAN